MIVCRGVYKAVFLHNLVQECAIQKCALQNNVHMTIQCLVIYSGYEPISSCASSGTSPGRSGACGAAKCIGVGWM